MPSTPMTGTDTHNGVARPAPAATQRSVETWMQGAQALTVPVDLMSKLPTVDLTRPVEQYFPVRAEGSRSEPRPGHEVGGTGDVAVRCGA